MNFNKETILRKLTSTLEATSYLLVTAAIVGVLFIATKNYAETKARATEIKTIPSTNNLVPTTVNDNGMLNTIYLPKTSGQKIVHNLALSNRVVQLFGEVNQDSARDVIEKIGTLNQESNEPITLVINSPGGSVLDGGTIVDAIEASKAPVNTLCVQLCASMAALIHQYGQKRMVLSHAILMFHPASGQAQDDIDRMVSLLSTIQRYTGKMEANAAKRSGLSFEEYKHRAAAQIWIDGEDAVQQHFADEVVFVKGASANELLPSNDPINKNHNSGNATFKGLVIKVLSASLQYLKGSDFPTLEEQLRRNFNDNPRNVAPLDDNSDLKPLYKNNKVRM